MKRSTILILIAGLGVSGLCCLACCLGILNFGVHMIAEEVRFELEADPRFVQHVGQVESFRLNYLASFGNGEDDVYAYDVTGTKWSGRMAIKHVTNGDGNEEILWARFTLPSGETIELPPRRKIEPEAGTESEPVPVDEEPARALPAGEPGSP